MNAEREILTDGKNCGETQRKDREMEEEARHELQGESAVILGLEEGGGGRSQGLISSAAPPAPRASLQRVRTVGPGGWAVKRAFHSLSLSPHPKDRETKAFRLRGRVGGKGTCSGSSPGLRSGA